MKPEFDNRAVGAIAPSIELPVNVDADHAPTEQPLNAVVSQTAAPSFERPIEVDAEAALTQTHNRPRILERRARRHARRSAWGL